MCDVRSIHSSPILYCHQIVSYFSFWLSVLNSFDSRTTRPSISVTYCWLCRETCRVLHISFMCACARARSLFSHRWTGINQTQKKPFIWNCICFALPNKYLWNSLFGMKHLNISLVLVCPACYDSCFSSRLSYGIQCECVILFLFMIE